MNSLPALFKNHLLLKRALSEITVKNYISDLRKFIYWFERSFEKTFQAKDLTSDVITLFMESRGGVISSEKLDFLNASRRSFERYLSSLRKFAFFLCEEGYISENPFHQIINNKQSIINNNDHWFIKEFKDYLYLYGASDLTIKNYAVDINAFTNWLDDVFKNHLNISKEYISNITPEIVSLYKQRLISELMLSPKTVNRKLSSIRKYLEFAANLKLLPRRQAGKTQSLNQEDGMNLDDLRDENTGSSTLNTGYSKLAPIRLLQRVLTPYVLLEDIVSGKIAGLITQRRLYKKVSKPISNTPLVIPWYAKLIHHAKYTRPEWYKRYHSYSFTRYFHLAILFIYASVLGLVLYNNLFPEQPKKAFAGPVVPLRILSFEGRLTDVNNNPIINPTDIRFGIYENEAATGSALLWQEVHHGITPDEDGIFSVLLGTKNGILNTLFRDRDLLWLGITIGNTPELTPRQRLAAVAYAANSESLQGMVPITDSTASTANVILALDSSGNLTIGGTASPTFAATGGTFKLSGTTLVLASSDGDIDIAPGAQGRVDIQRPIINDTASGSLTQGAVEINDKFAIIATESAVAAFVVDNSTTGGDIITASSSGTTRFTLANDGDLMLSGDILTAASLSTFTTGTTLGITAANLNLGGGIAATIGTVSGDNLTITPDGIGDLTLTSDSDTGVNIGSASNSPAVLSISGGLGSNPALIVNQLNSGDILTASSSGTTRLRLGNGGALTLTSGISESNTGQYLCINTSSYEVVRNNSACSLSSSRFKENVSDLAYGLSDVLNLRPVTFNFRKELNMGSGLEVGFIAEEVEQIIPELVSYDSQGRPSGVNYPNIAVILTKAIRELDSKNEEIASELISMSQGMRDYIITVVTEAGLIQEADQIVSGIASIDRIRTNIISPLADNSEISLDLRGSKFEVRSSTASDSAVVASIDNQGNASFSGSLVAKRIESENASISGELAVENLNAREVYTEGLEARSATVSGTLYADKIVANSIEGLEADVSSESANTDFASNILNTEYSILNTDFVDIQNLSSDFATFRDGFISLGPATFPQATILDSLSIGLSFVISANSINTLGQALEIQPLKQGAISFMAGAVKIETDGSLVVLGNAEFAGDVKVGGKLSANMVSPLSENPLVIASEAINATDSAILDIQGSASVSGTLTSRKLNLAFAEQAYATSDIEAVATGSAGIAILKKYRTEITVYNPNVTEKSLIYITPFGSTNNKVLYLLRQTPEDNRYEGIEGSFTVGVNTASTITDLEFNWIIVN